MGTAFVEASIGGFSATHLNEGVRATNRDLAPVVIVGMPRFGTTLVEQILTAHREVFGAGERTALGEVFAALGGVARRCSVPASIIGAWGPVH
jgi:hypothetical protein